MVHAVCTNWGSARARSAIRISPVSRHRRCLRCARRLQTPGLPWTGTSESGKARHRAADSLRRLVADPIRYLRLAHLVLRMDQSVEDPQIALFNCSAASTQISAISSEFGVADRIDGPADARIAITEFGERRWRPAM